LRGAGARLDRAPRRRRPHRGACRGERGQSSAVDHRIPPGEGVTKQFLEARRGWSLSRPGGPDPGVGPASRADCSGGLDYLRRKSRGRTHQSRRPKTFGQAPKGLPEGGLADGWGSVVVTPGSGGPPNAGPQLLQAVPEGDQRTVRHGTGHPGCRFLLDLGEQVRRGGDRTGDCRRWR